MHGLGRGVQLDRSVDASVVEKVHLKVLTHMTFVESQSTYKSNILHAMPCTVTELPGCTYMGDIEGDYIIIQG